jgi:hypothetical protein
MPGSPSGQRAAQIDPAHHGADRHRQARRRHGEHQAVGDGPARHVIVQQDEFVVGEGQSLPEIAAPGFAERDRQQRAVGQHDGDHEHQSAEREEQPAPSPQIDQLRP